MLRISSRHNPIVARFRAAARGEAPDLILLDGPHLITEALAAQVQIVTAAVGANADQRIDIVSIVERLSRTGTDIVHVTAPVLDALSPVRTPSPIVGIGRRPMIDPGRVFVAAQPLVVIAVDVQDPGNVGAIVRVAEAAGASGVITTTAAADPLGWKALRGSMGSALRLPLARYASAAAAVESARVHSCRIVAAVPRDASDLYETQLTGPTAIVIGGEGAGLPPAVVAAADEQITIPMESPVESLNAAVTAALILYEIRRQRSRTVVKAERSTA